MSRGGSGRVWVGMGDVAGPGDMDGEGSVGGEGDVSAVGMDTGVSDATGVSWAGNVATICGLQLSSNAGIRISAPKILRFI